MLFAFVASITPGPTNILILANSQHHGVKATLPALVSGCVAASMIVLISGAGAGEILHQHPLVRQVMSWAGVAWLSWMSWQLFSAPATNVGKPSHRFTRARRALLQIVNPKTWMMALAVVSLFAPTGSHALRDIALMALWFLLISIGCLLCWAWLGKAVNRVFRTTVAMVRFQRVMALCLLISAWVGVFGRSQRPAATWRHWAKRRMSSARRAQSPHPHGCD